MRKISSVMVSPKSKVKKSKSKVTVSPRGFYRYPLHNNNGVLNHRCCDCLLNRLSRRRWKKTSKLCVTSLCGGIQWWPVNSPHKRPVTRKMFPFDDVIMWFSSRKARKWATWQLCPTFSFQIYRPEQHDLHQVPFHNLFPVSVII